MNCYKSLAKTPDVLQKAGLLTYTLNTHSIIAMRTIIIAALCTLLSIPTVLAVQKAGRVGGSGGRSGMNILPPPEPLQTPVSHFCDWIRGSVDLSRTYRHRNPDVALGGGRNALFPGKVRVAPLSSCIG